MNTLHVVATPIGNLGDVTLRSLEVLTVVDLIAAEDTRVTRRLLIRHGISTRLTSYHEHSPPSKLATILDTLCEADVALVCDAGTPGISDPGRELVKRAAESGAAVVTVPGASSVTAAVSVSGLTVNGFVFLGFLPRSKGDRRRLLTERLNERLALVVLEAPRRLRSCLEEMLEVMGDREIAVCREMTKMHEEVFRGTLSAAIEHFTIPRGEFTMVVAGAPQLHVDNALLELEARRMLSKLLLSGVTGRDAVAEVTDVTGLPKRRVYEMMRSGDTISS